MTNELLDAVNLSDVEVALTCPNCKRRYFPRHENIPLWCSSCTPDDKKESLVAGFQTPTYEERKRVETLVNALLGAAALKPTAAFPFAVLLVPFHDKPEYRFPRAASSTDVTR